MSSYTLVSFTCDEAEELSQQFTMDINSRNTSTRNGVTAARLANSNMSVEDVIDELIDPDNGTMIYDYPLKIGENEPGELLGYLVVSFYEDTGDHHEAKLFKVFEYEDPKLMDEVELYDDRTGEKLEEYYEEQFGINTIIKAIP
jgi:hypothetical protein